VLPRKVGLRRAEGPSKASQDPEFATGHPLAGGLPLETSSAMGMAGHLAALKTGAYRSAVKNSRAPVN
jgi:hypothetical protein